jgi:hypothetical protein
MEPSRPEHTMEHRAYHLGGPTVLAMLAAVVVPTALTLSTVRHARPLVPVDGDPSPLGYTVSLGFWVIPALCMAWWFFRHEEHEIPDKKAFYATLGVLPALGCGLDVLLATRFFTFENHAATLGLDVPVVGGTVPVEEFVFYIMGFVVILLGYVWVKTTWLGSRTRMPAPPRGLLRLHWPSFLLCLALVGAGWLFKRYGPVADHDGFPGYFAFLVLIAFAPVVLMFDSVRALISWRAFSLVSFATVGVSQLWEASLAVPYQWWGYRGEQMLGVFIPGWSGLPIEAALLWLVVTWATVTWYEAFRVLFAHPAGWRAALRGSLG